MFLERTFGALQAPVLYRLDTPHGGPHTLGVTPTTGSSSLQSGPTVHVPFVWLCLRVAQGVLWPLLKAQVRTGWGAEPWQQLPPHPGFPDGDLAQGAQKGKTGEPSSASPWAAQPGLGRI